MADNVIVRVPEQQFIRGEDGYSPEVTIENIEHGHSVTITDRDHPTGQSFNVMDGDSAYEQAVAGGYTGAEAQFNEELASFKELSDETKDAAPFYAEYGETTKAEIAAAINGKRQVYVRRGELGTHYAPLVGTYLHTPLFGSDLETGYRFAITEGTTQRIYELGNVWATRENDLAAPAQRAETAAAQALIRMNSADASAQEASASATAASQAEGNAANSATAAAGSATAAAGSASTASTAATTAQGHATNAASSATAASGSATSAASSATAAGNAQTAAETAQAAAEDAQEAAEAVLASIPSDYTELSGDVDDLKSAVTKTVSGNPVDFVNKYIAWDGKEADSSKLAVTKRYFNYMQDGLLTVEVAEPYVFYAYGWKRAACLGYFGNTGWNSGGVKLLTKLNLSEFPDVSFKFGLRHVVNGTSVDVTTEEAVNFTFTFRQNSSLANRKISVMGDSISSFDGYTSPNSPAGYYPRETARLYYAENMYWKCLADRNGMVIDTIDAFAGSTVADKWQDTVRIPFYDDSRINRLGNPDVIIVEGGINDFGGNPLGDYPAIDNYTKTYEFRTGYSLLLNKLKNKYKNATIICLSMTSPRTYNNTTFPEKQTEVVQALATDTTPHTFAEFNESIEKIAKQYQCAYCDITDLLNYYSNPTSSLGPHWYFNLHMDVAYRIEQKLKEIYA